MGDGLKHCAGFLTCLAMAACHAGPPGGTPDGAGKSADSPLAGAPGVSLRLLEREFSLDVQDGQCSVSIIAPGNSVEQLRTELKPPCYLVRWLRPPPSGDRDQSVSDGRPIGAVGDLMAWRYGGEDGSIAIAVLGDPIPDRLKAGSLYKVRQQQGMNCVSSVQGIVISNNRSRLSTKRAQTGIYCAELGLEEKDFWLIGHE